jgi:hypothetical protein
MYLVGFKRLIFAGHESDLINFILCIRGHDISYCIFSDWMVGYKYVYGQHANTSSTCTVSSPYIVGKPHTLRLIRIFVLFVHLHFNMLTACSGHFSLLDIITINITV